METLTFETLKEAEDYYFENFAINNEDEDGLEIWLERGVANNSIIIKENE